MDGSGALVLAVDDDPLTCRLVEFLLRSQGYEVLTEADPLRALSHVVEQPVDLVLLDVQLPRMSGFELLRRIKAQSQNLPVIMVSARAEIREKVAALEAGADDYVTKPFEPSELLSRAKAVLRRGDGSPAPVESRVEAGGLRLDTRRLAVTLPDGREVALTPTEARVLGLLMSQPGGTLTREQILERAAGSAEISENHVDVYIARIRRKLGDDPAGPRYIQTVRGSGYRFIARQRGSASAAASAS